jgi:hypothetical protein
MQEESDQFSDWTTGSLLNVRQGMGNSLVFEEWVPRMLSGDFEGMGKTGLAIMRKECVHYLPLLRYACCCAFWLADCHRL